MKILVCDTPLRMFWQPDLAAALIFSQRNDLTGFFAYSITDVAQIFEGETVCVPSSIGNGFGGAAVVAAGGDRVAETGQAA